MFLNETLRAEMRRNEPVVRSSLMRFRVRRFLCGLVSLHKADAMAVEIPGLFVTGTDTGVGKTFLSVLIAEQLRREGFTVGAYKPACSGAIETSVGPIWEDVEALHAATGSLFDRDRICPQRFLAPVAPPVAARQEGRRVDPVLLKSGAAWWMKRCDFLIVEGAGGLLCPLTEDETFADLALDLCLPLLIVARATLGTINHTLLTIEAARNRGLAIAGVVLNEVIPAGDDSSAATNAAEITRRSGATLLGIAPHGRSDRLLREGTSPRIIDWRAVAKAAIPPGSRSPFPKDQGNRKRERSRRLEPPEG